jgi:hypothetical protein
MTIGIVILLGLQYRWTRRPDAAGTRRPPRASAGASEPYGDDGVESSTHGDQSSGGAPGVIQWHFPTQLTALRPELKNGHLPLR